MKTFLLTTAILALSASPSFADEISKGEVLSVENFIGTIILNTGGTNKLEITKAKNDDTISVRNSSSKLSIDGGITKLNRNKCSSHYSSLNIQWSARSGIKKSHYGGYDDLRDYPTLTISAPDNVHVVIRNAIPFLAGGDIGSADIEMRACGRVELEDIKGDAKINLRGSGDISVNDMQNLDLDLKGSGDFEGGNAEHVKISLFGSGDVDLEDIASAELNLFGSGDVETGDVGGPLSVSSFGSGDIVADDVTGDMTYDGRGSGDFSLESVTGNISIDVRGSGDVDIDDGTAGDIIVNASGASDVDFGGTAKNADLKASGASDIYIYEATGDVSKRERGASDITVRSQSDRP